MRYLSLCSGIEAATQAWHPMGWTPVAFSEIEKFPSAVLAHHYPNVPNWGDMTKFKEWPDAAVDVLVGGTPCQSFSVAGLRKGLADPRGNLALTYLAIAERYRPRWLVWENVPGVLSSDGGRAFGAIIGGMVELGYCPAWRVLDAQYVRTRRFRRAVPQRRRRVFVVAHLGDWRRAAAVLFDAESLRGNPPPGREAGQTTAHSVAPCIGASGRGFERAGETRGQDQVVAHETGLGWWKQAEHAGALRAEGENIPSRPSHVVANSLRAEGFDASEDGTGRGTPIVPEVCGTLSDGAHMGGGLNGQDAYYGRVIPVAFDTTQITSKANYSNPKPGDPCHPLAAGAHPPAVAFHNRQDPDISGDVTHPLGSMDDGMGVMTAAGFKRGQGEKAGSLGYQLGVSPTLTGMDSGTQNPPGIHTGMAVRRLTPRECERLQGFPDDFTRIPWRGKDADKCPDGPRYKALGNSFAVNVVSWIGQRIEMVQRIADEELE